ncbi:MAG TPA: alpha/beta fold hydrolase [Acidimicrobiales bacterium]|nr:alpha/beta fold hydrolase [Acidimicrobiales bacterium]
MNEQIIDLVDGRKLEVATMGDPSGHTVLFHHGTPGSYKTFRFFEPLLDRGNYFLVTTSRAGYGASTRLEGRTIASVVDDARATLRHFRRDAYAVVGWSGGGPHALACAALDASRCRRAVTLASVAPQVADFDWTEGMGPENLEEFALATKGGAEYEEYMAVAGAFIADMTKDNAIELMGGLLPEADKEVLADDRVRELFADAMSYGFAKGWRGYYDDNRAFFLPWGFDVTAIEIPVALFYGDADLMVPPAHGAWLSGHVRRASTHHIAAEGHLSIYARHFDEIATELAAAFT